MSDISKRRPRRPSRVEVTISTLTALGDPPEFVALWVGVTPEEVERRLRQPRMKAMVERARARQAQPLEERLARLQERAREILDDWLRSLDTTGVLPN